MIEAEEQSAENEKKRQELKHAYKRLFDSDDGKIVLKDLRSFCGQDRSSICSSSPNPYQTFECEGKRRVYLRIASQIKVKENDNA